MMRVCDVSVSWRSAAAPRRHVITARGGERRGGSGGAGTQRFTPPERLLSAAPGAEQVGTLVSVVLPCWRACCGVNSRACRLGASVHAADAHCLPPPAFVSTPCAFTLRCQGRKDTVYTLRLSTGLQRGAALTDPTGGVLVVRLGCVKRLLRRWRGLGCALHPSRPHACRCLLAGWLCPASQR